MTTLKFNDVTLEFSDFWSTFSDFVIILGHRSYCGISLAQDVCPLTERALQMAVRPMHATSHNPVTVGASEYVRGWRWWCLVGVGGSNGGPSGYNAWMSGYVAPPTPVGPTIDRFGTNTSGFQKFVRMTEFPNRIEVVRMTEFPRNQR